MPLVYIRGIVGVVELKRGVYRLIKQCLYICTSCIILAFMGRFPVNIYNMHTCICFLIYTAAHQDTHQLFTAAHQATFHQVTAAHQATFHQVTTVQQATYHQLTAVHQHAHHRAMTVLLLINQAIAVRIPHQTNISLLSEF